MLAPLEVPGDVTAEEVEEEAPRLEGAERLEDVEEGGLVPPAAL